MGIPKQSALKAAWQKLIHPVEQKITCAGEKALYRIKQFVIVNWNASRHIN